MLYIFIKDLGSKKVGMKVNMNLNKQSSLIKDGYVKRYDAEEVTEEVAPIEEVTEEVAPIEEVVEEVEPIEEVVEVKKTRTKKQ